MKDHHVDLGYIFRGCGGGLLVVAVLLLAVRSAKTIRCSSRQVVV
jgi:hypothetical protein